ncbi:right-handed parallel beta-helix repeat-containing protein [Hymenobacter roseosalivarius]|uniref:right-handed parallel beta-helix repeat-containing protein n=1 Tax=Hymenobacter roseosalivarius TaxID=89967 RepID=UPI00117A183B|nr:right-handed parallel beta-helix repeat-containing protein [Hymenobacter roseosalivarius]
MIALFSWSAQASTYYINSNGDDAAAGTSVASAWRTVGRVNARRYQPGDRILFAGGQTFSGGIWLRGNSQGTAAQPIVISSYGRGSATIESGTSFGFYGHNMAGLELRRLIFVGAGRLSNANSGVILYVDSANTHLSHLRLDSLDVSGYQSAGILIGSWNGSSGYSNVRITNSRSHANGEAGIQSWAETLRAHTNWYVANCQTYDNSGRADITDLHTGNGIVLSGIDGALIEHCESYNNGWLNANPYGGPVGIWGYHCNNLVIQECESHHNRSGTALDGGGFDLDGGCTNSILQYNYSHDNEGAGYLLAQYDGAPPLTDVTIRYNISENDARRNSHGAIMLWSSGASGGIQRASIYNNTVYLTPPTNGSRPKAVDITSGGISAITLRNNIFYTTGGLSVVNVQPSGMDAVLFQGNCYWSAEAELGLDWGGTRYTTLNAWRTASGQEQVRARACGINADPHLIMSGEESRLPRNAPTTPLLAATYHLQSVSSLLGAGLNLLVDFNQTPGPRDYYGNPTPQLGLTGNIGASENNYVVLSTRTSPGINSQAWCTAYPTLASETVKVVFASETGLNTPVSLRLYDSQGRLCRAQSCIRQYAAEVAFSVTGLPAGRYLLQIEHGVLRCSKPIIVAN